MNDNQFLGMPLTSTYRPPVAFLRFQHIAVVGMLALTAPSVTILSCVPARGASTSTWDSKTSKSATSWNVDAARDGLRATAAAHGLDYNTLLDQATQNLGAMGILNRKSITPASTPLTEEELAKWMQQDDDHAMS